MQGNFESSFFSTLHTFSFSCTIGTYDRYASIKRSPPHQHYSKTFMKKLLIISIVLVAAGLSLILYSDPVILQAGGSPPPGGGQIFNATSVGGGGLPGNCHTVNGVTVCSGSFQSLSDPNAEIETIAGIGLCGGGLFLTAIETISKPKSPYQTKAVT